MEKAKRIAIPVVAVACVAALIYLLFFFGRASVPKSELTTTPQMEYTITFETDQLEYTDGVSFMEGVIATDEKGNDLTEYITVSCKPTDNMFKKTLTYSINKSGYKIQAFERTLIVDGSYNGPSIEMVETSIEVPLDQVKNLSSIVASSSAIKTNDGFGGECGITATISNSEITLGDYVATITAQNMLGDTATAKITITVVQPEGSIIKLSASSITISRGDTFNPGDYVVSASHEEYGDLTPYVVASQDYDTSKAGIYTIEYKIQGIAELKDQAAYLYLTVN